MSPAARVVVEADGGARGNPGPAGWGALVRDAVSGQVLMERAAAIGSATNNVAEYSGLIAGLQAAVDLGAAQVEVKMDSKLVIEQMAGRWRIKHPGLRPLAAQAAALVRRFDRVEWTWVPRERNRDADRLANEAMDEAAGRGAGGKGKGEPPQTVAAATASDRVDAGPATEDRVAATSLAASATSNAAGPSPGARTRLVLVRHGETSLTAGRRYSGRDDVPLTERGHAQAQAIAQRIVAMSSQVAAVVSSPLRRCTDTASVVAAAADHAPVMTESALTECDFGQWEGRTFEEVRADWPEQLALWEKGAAAPPRGESRQQLTARVRQAVAGLRSTYPGVTVVVVSHVWPLKVMLRDALAGGEEFWHRLWLSPGGLSVIDSHADGTVVVHSVNETSHLP